MAQNISYASNDTAIESLVLHIRPDFGEHGDGIIENNFTLSFLKANGRMKVKEGGLEFWKGIMKQGNSNFKWQGKEDTMSAQLQDPNDRLRFDIKTFTGSIVINKLDEARNKGRAAIKDYAMTLRDQAESTIPNEFNSAFWNASPGSNEPESIPSIISATPDSGSLGGVNRAGNKYMQNGLDDQTLADIGSEAGVARLTKNIIQQAQGSSGKSKIDLMVTTADLYAGLAGYLADKNRFRPDDKMAQLGFDAIKLGTTTIGYENVQNTDSYNTIKDNYLYGINSNNMFFEVLRDGNFKWDDKFERVGMTLNKALYFWAFCNLTTNLPKSHLLMTDVNTA